MSSTMNQSSTRGVKMLVAAVMDARDVLKRTADVAYAAAIVDVGIHRAEQRTKIPGKHLLALLLIGDLEK